MDRIRNKRVHMVSLGCAKNRVDSEKTLYILKQNGCTIADDPLNADLALVNSCGFINDARMETVETVLELARLKKKNKSLKIAVMGCMVERLKKEMQEEMPEIDYLISLTDETASEVYRPSNDKRVVQEGAVSAYLKIAEGCGNSCSFCSIPLIRGPLKSRQMEEIINEAKLLVEKGIKEICIVGQDTTRYGADLKIKQGLVKLLLRLLEIKPEWIRVMYAYPSLVSGEIIETVARYPSICPYMDIPFQHIDGRILKSMGRNETEGDIKRLVEKIRKKMPEGAIRSSFIVGFPGETEAQFRKLEEFLKDAKLDHVGVFAFSPEEGTAARNLPGKVPEEVKLERKNRLMEIQKEISQKLNTKKIGKTFAAIVDRYDDSENMLIGRLQTHAPEIDGEVILDNCDASPGDIIQVEITSALEYDLVGQPATTPVLPVTARKN